MPGRREFLRKSAEVAAVVVGGVAGHEIGRRSAGQPESVQKDLDIQEVVKLGCGDSRHVGLVRVGKSVILPDFMYHVKNAGAAPNEDLKSVIDFLKKEKNLRPDQILVMATSHWNPKCGGAVVDRAAIRQIKEELAHFGFSQEHLTRYLKSYGFSEKDVFASVPLDPADRAKEHGRQIHREHGVHVISGTFDMEKGDFHPIYVSDSRLRNYELIGKDFAEHDPMYKHQEPEHLLLAVPGTNLRGSPFSSPRALQHWSPDVSFAVSVNPERPSARSILSILYFGHLTPKPHGEHGHGPSIPPKVILAGTKEQLSRLAAFSKSDAYVRHMVEHGFWDPTILREHRN